MIPEFLAAALSYAARGWSIIPIWHRPNTPGKQPALRSWTPFQTVRPTEAELRQMFGNGRKLDGLAVIFGKVSGGLVCRDFDKAVAYECWAAAHSELAATLPTVRTPRGYHVYFTADTDRIITLADGELRGAGYCLLPPSRHPSGAIYKWLIQLPDGPLPRIDPREAGLMDGETERSENTERTEDDRENRASNCSVPSADSVDSVLSVSRGGLDRFVADAIQSTLPSHEGQRNRALFEFARTLKGHPDLADAEPPALREIVKRWHARALPYIGTKPFDETWAEFLVGWSGVLFPKGQSLAGILRLSDAAPDPACAQPYDAIATRRLIRLCREVQKIVGDRAFWVSCRDASALLGLSVKGAWERLRMLEAERLLKVVERGTKQKATRYRYLGD